MGAVRLVSRGRGVTAAASAMCLAAVCGMYALLAPAASASECLTGQQTFSYTGAEASYVVAAGVTRVQAVAVGAPGGGGGQNVGGSTVPGGPGGFGARVTADLAVTPGEVLYVEVGGSGGGVANTADPGGVGGFNGGGAGGSIGGGGGGGGSSLGPAGAGFAADTTGTPSVTLTPLPLFAAIQPGVASLTFPTQAQSTIGPPQTLTIANAQTATAPLQITALSFTGADPGGFLIGSSTCGGEVQPGQSGQVTVDFAPDAQGQRTATLEIFGNDPNGPATVGLSGTGGNLPAGAQGPGGAQGVQGPVGPQEAAGKIELVTCTTVTKKVKGRRRQVHTCTGRLVTGTVKFTLAAGSAHATISRNGTVYATGASVAAGVARSWMVLSDRRPLTHGRYTADAPGPARVALDQPPHDDHDRLSRPPDARANGKGSGLGQPRPQAPTGDSARSYAAAGLRYAAVQYRHPEESGDFAGDVVVEAVRGVGAASTPRRTGR
jgi:hypothetical protein